MFECIVKNVKTITSTRTQKKNKRTSNCRKNMGNTLKSCFLNIRNTTIWNRLYYDKINFKNMPPYRNAKTNLRNITEFSK